MIDIRAILILIPGIILGAFASIMLKKGAKRFTLHPMKLLKNYNVIYGIILFCVSAVFYIFALQHGNLSLIYPLSSFSYVLIALLSTKLLGEKMNIQKWIGIIFIILGSFLIVR